MASQAEVSLPPGHTKRAQARTRLANTSMTNTIEESFFVQECIRLSTQGRSLMEPALVQCTARRVGVRDTLHWQGLLVWLVG